jgi:uncharacterized membrane protein YhaH (DUF805 family)
MITDDKKIDILISLANSSQSEYDTRRTYEWKVSFGLWTAIGVISGFALKENFNLPMNSFLIYLLLTIIFLAYIWFQYGLHKSNDHDQKKRYFYIKTFIHPEIGIDHNHLDPENKKLFEKTKPSKGKFYQVWSHGSQILITGVFLIILGVILTNKEIRTNKFNNKSLEHHRAYYRFHDVRNHQ